MAPQIAQHGLRHVAGLTWTDRIDHAMQIAPHKYHDIHCTTYIAPPYHGPHR